MTTELVGWIGVAYAASMFGWLCLFRQTRGNGGHAPRGVWRRKL